MSPLAPVRFATEPGRARPLNLRDVDFISRWSMIRGAAKSSVGSCGGQMIWTIRWLGVFKWGGASDRLTTIFSYSAARSRRPLNIPNILI